MEQKHVRGLIMLLSIRDRTWHVFRTQQEAADYLHVSRPMISMALHGKLTDQSRQINGHYVYFLRKEYLK
jgi:predicted XRE-type DNA-binding protein